MLKIEKLLIKDKFKNIKNEVSLQILNSNSRINQDFLKKTIHEMLETRKKRGFPETIEL